MSTRTGDLGEAAFLTEATKQGFTVSTPWGHSNGYDLVLDGGERLFKIQVKCCKKLAVPQKGTARRYKINTRRGTNTRAPARSYAESDTDFISVYLPGPDRFFNIPVKEVSGTTMIAIPEKVDSLGYRWRDYLENWDVFKG